jgi:hypothetical protein
LHSPPSTSDWEFSWLARNLAPVKNQKIHWASEPGTASLPGLNIANRGQIRFVRRGPAACSVALSISYEVPEMLVPFANVRRLERLQRGPAAAGGPAKHPARRPPPPPQALATRRPPPTPPEPTPPSPHTPHPTLTPHPTPQAVTPLVEGIIGKDMERFRDYAQEYAKAAAAGRAVAAAQQQSEA